jgi:hypothetical protein
VVNTLGRRPLTLGCEEKDQTGGDVNTAKRHHYLPQFYLDGFTRDDGRFFVFDQEHGDGRTATPLNTAAIGYYYAFVDETGARVSEVESDLSRIEGRTKPVFEALAKREPISDEQRFALAVFLGFLACRTPAYERFLNARISGLGEVILRKNLQAANTDGLFDRAGEIEKFLESGRFGLRIHPNERISSMIEHAPNLGRAVFVSNWTVLHAERNAFVTSDSPFALIGPRLAAKSFPMSSQLCLVMSGTGGRLCHARAADKWVERINHAIALESERLVIGHDERQVRRLVKRAGLRPGREKPRIVVEEHPHPSGDPARSILVTRRMW